MAQESFLGRSLEGYLSQAFKDRSYPGVKERAEIGHRKHFKQNHWSVRKQGSQKEPGMVKNIQIICVICCLGAFGGVETG